MAVFSHLRTEPVYNTRAVVQRTGVPADTFRAWERRYGVPAPARTAGNQRLYSERDIATISWLKDQTRAGITISQAVRLFRAPAGNEDESPLTRGQGDQSGPAGHADERMTRFRDAVVDALVRFDAETAARAVEEALALVSVEDVCLHVLQPALYEIGRQWEAGTIGISVEHFASAFIGRRLSALFNLSRPEQGRGPVVAACLEGELHEVGLLLTCLFLSRRGFHIVYLGANLPLSDLIETTERLKPPIVLLSASTSESAQRLAKATRLLAAGERDHGRADDQCPIIGYGGHIFGTRPELRDQVDAHYLGRDAAEAARLIERVVNDRGRLRDPLAGARPGRRLSNSVSPMLDSPSGETDPEPSL